VARDYEAELRQVLESTGKPVAPDPQIAAARPSTTEETPPTVEKGPEAVFSAKNLFVHHDSHPLVLDIKLIDKYKTDWFEWSPETLWREIMDDFRTPSISDHVKSKIQAVRTVHLSDWTFSKWEVFSIITQALNNNIPDFEIMRKPTISQLFAAVDIITMIRNDVEFSQEIQDWCGASMIDEGVIFAPQPIAFCQDEILAIQESIGAPVDPKPVQERWKSVASLPANEIVLEENPIDIQVAKLIVARDYMQMRRDQMKVQLEVLT
jgi:hypothetical protein